MLQYLARPLVGAHLQTDGGLVHRGLNLSFGVVQVPPGAVCIHPCLTGTLVGPHLETKNTYNSKNEPRKEDSGKVERHTGS